MNPFVRLPRTLGARSLVALGLMTGSALASPEYPTVVRNTVGMECTPDCTLCHQSTPGTGSPITQPFALDTLLSNSPTGFLQAANPELLEDTLVAAMAANPPPDADTDGIPDFVELTGSQITTDQLTTNPNVADTADVPSANICPPEPKYGCGAAHVTPRPHVHAELVLFALLASALGLGLWRRGSQRRQG
jgi:hypothetical protein